MRSAFIIPFVFGLFANPYAHPVNSLLQYDF